MIVILDNPIPLIDFSIAQDRFANGGGEAFEECSIVVGIDFLPIPLLKFEPPQYRKGATRLPHLSGDLKQR